VCCAQAAAWICAGRTQRFTVHMSIRGALIAACCAGVKLLEFVVEGDTREPALEIINNSKPLPYRLLYTPELCQAHSDSQLERK
jgi:hypothetical protein